MEGVPVLYEVRPVRIPSLDLHHAPARRHRYLRCFLIFCAFLFFMLLLYIPAFHHTRTREDQTHAGQRVAVKESHMQLVVRWRPGGNGRKVVRMSHHKLLLNNFHIFDDQQALPVSVPGWAHNRSRDLHLYVVPGNLTALIPQPDICTPKLFLLVVICSAVGNFQAREAIRETWASAWAVADKSMGVRVAFLLGDPDNSTLQDMVEEESRFYGDIIQESFIDSYNNLTLKTVMMLKWVRMHCSQVRFVMKTDDDMFVNLKSLVRLLRAKGGPGLLLGALICGARPISDISSKWYSPRYMYAGRVYPNYVSGTGYVMSVDVVLNLYQTALHTPFFHLEDVYLTGICARKANIRPRDHQSFSYGLRRMDPCLLRDRSVVTSHRVDMKQMKKVWAQIKNPNLNCTAFRASLKPVLKPTGGKKVANVRRPGNRCV